MPRLRARFFCAAPFVTIGAAACALCFAPGCQSENTTVFPPGLDATAPDPVSPPSADDAGPYPEILSLVQGDDPDYSFVSATGYVDAPIAAVWDAFKNPNVVVDRHGVNSYTVTPNVESGYDVSFLTAYTINNIVTVQFSLTWREGVVAGTEAAPTQVSVVYEKTYGSSFVSLMEGSIELAQVTPSVTELQFVQRMNATNTSSANIASWTNELFASVVATVHGQPLP